MNDPLAIGLDFGTESVRALAVSASTGAELATAVETYPHGVMDAVFQPTGAALPPDFALQDPQDYLDCASRAVRTALGRGGLKPARVIGLGVDATACTPLPVDDELNAIRHRFPREPHAYVKLWKHHGANQQAHRFNESARARDEKFLARYGGAISSEWILPKLLETWENAPHVLEASARFIEMSDWFVSRIVGREVRGSCAAGYKGLYHDREGYPGDDYLESVHGDLPALAKRLLGRTFLPAGKEAGTLTNEGAELLGLPRGVSVSPPIIDAHAAVPGCGIDRANRLVAILGTSACHMIMHETEVPVRGIQGYVRDGIVPGFFGYEAGQAAFGDVFAWFAEKCLGRDKGELAKLEGTAARMQPAECGLLALDWWNGNRSVLINPELSGMIVGLTMSSTPSEIYRALIEATAFGTRRIMENFTAFEIPVEEVAICGGIAEKSDFIAQLLADVSGRPIQRPKSQQVCALGAAIFGAAAAPSSRGGYDGDVSSAIQAMTGAGADRFEPDLESHAIYNELYSEWNVLHDHFGHGGHDVMERLRRLRSR